jgi:hypothetical protein
MDLKKIRQEVNRIFNYYNATEEQIEKRKKYFQEYRQKNIEKIVNNRQSQYIQLKAKLKLNPDMLNYNKEYYKNNREQILQKNHEYYLKNREKILEKYKNNPQKTEYSKEYYDKNKKRILENKKEYYKTKIKGQTSLQINS